MGTAVSELSRQGGSDWVTAVPGDEHEHPQELR